MLQENRGQETPEADELNDESISNTDNCGAKTEQCYVIDISAKQLVWLILQSP